MDAPVRKRLRLEHYDYAQNGAYFVTLCVYNREKLFGEPGGSSPAAAIVETTFFEALHAHPGVSAPAFVIMPNHFHAILVIARAHLPGAEFSRADTTVSGVIQTFKRLSTIRYGQAVRRGELPPYDGQLWQRSYFDRIIRDENEYLLVYRYIQDNPRKWQSDEMFR